MIRLTSFLLILANATDYKAQTRSAFHCGKKFILQTWHQIVSRSKVTQQNLLELAKKRKKKSLMLHS